MPRSKLDVSEADVELATRTLFREAAAMAHKLHENGFYDVQVHSQGFGPSQRQMPTVFIMIPVKHGLDAERLTFLAEEFSDNNLRIAEESGNLFMRIWPHR